MRHGSVPKSLESFVDEKLGRLERYLTDSSRIEFILEKEHETFKCEMIVHSGRRGGQVVVHDDASEDVRTSIDQVIEKMSRRLKKSKELRKDHHRGSGLGEEFAQPASDSDAGTDEPSYEDIVNRQLKGK